MDQGYIRVAAATPKIRVADPVYNGERILELMREGAKRQVKLMVFPELCITAYTCNDLFLQDRLLSEAKRTLAMLRDATAEMDLLAFVGLPWEQGGRLYNVAAALSGGKVLGLVPKLHIPNYSEYYEGRYFARGNETPVRVDFMGEKIPMGTRLIFACEEIPELRVSAEICEDLWVASPPSIGHALAGATVVVNCSASVETVGKDDYRRALVGGQSGRLVCGYIYASAGEGESSQDLVFGGHNLIAENGAILAEAKRFTSGLTCAELDLWRLRSERRRMNTYPGSLSLEDGRAGYGFRDGVRPGPGGAWEQAAFHLKPVRLELERPIDPAPFVPHDEKERSKRCEEILNIQSLGLKKRLEHTGTKCAVLGISGGLDSTLALLVTARAFDLLGLPRKQIIAVTMPCFGTTDRTYHNACVMTGKLGATLREIDIKAAVTQHFRDIGHDPDSHDVTYENSQARERTQILMDVANQEGGLVIGTGDMSELALGWATYNGDHMSMYGVNASVPKTLVRHLVRYYADSCGEEELRDVLLDVLDTPVSPELLPPAMGTISQKTEDLVGPYELHDFFLYYVLRFGFGPARIYRMALAAFAGGGKEARGAGESAEESGAGRQAAAYEPAVIKKWLQVFYRRFFSQQFKRSCLPDGPKVGSVALSPRGDLRMPSDAVSRIWMEEIERL